MGERAGERAHEGQASEGVCKRARWWASERGGQMFVSVHKGARAISGDVDGMGERWVTHHH